MGEARTFVGRWSGKVRAGAEHEHAEFLERLGTPDAANLLRKCSLTEYSLYQRSSKLEIVFRAGKPVLIAGFLRNKRMWPSFWEFERPGDRDVPTDKPLVFRWAREDEGPTR